MPSDWRHQICQAVSPLEHGVRELSVNNFRDRNNGEVRPARTAAVLVPILDTEDPAVVLTRRADHLAHHAGQVSFPGGRAEKDDDSGVFTALREAHEEIGLQPDNVQPLGFLDRFDSVSDYRVLPVVGMVNMPGPWLIDRSEVAEVFTVPLEIVLDDKQYTLERYTSNGQSYRMHALEWNGHTIWGLTAAMLKNLQHRVNGIK